MLRRASVILQGESRFVTSRPLRCARHNFTGAAEIVADLRRRRDYIGCVEYGVQRLSVRGANAPAIDGQDARASAEVDTGECLADTGRPIAETDIAIAPAGLAELDESSILQSLNEDGKLTTRCSSA